MCFLLFTFFSENRCVILRNHVPLFANCNVRPQSQYVRILNEYSVVTIVLPLPNPDDPKQHEACCPLCKTQQTTYANFTHSIDHMRKFFQSLNHPSFDCDCANSFLHLSKIPPLPSILPARPHVNSNIISFSLASRGMRQTNEY